MYLTASFGIRANAHDRRRLNAAMRRWHDAFRQSLARAHRRQRDLLRCLEVNERTGKLKPSGKRLHAIVLECVTSIETHLHSSVTMSLVVQVEAALASWLGLYAAWANEGRTAPKPSFPDIPPLAARSRRSAWEGALRGANAAHSKEEFAGWQARLTRESRDRCLPVYFGAATSGVAGQAHCGLLLRDDGRLFALLTLWPAGDPLGEPVRRAPNRAHTGEIRNVRAADDDKPFSPTDRARASMLLPLELGRGHRSLFLRRAIPKSAELFERDGRFRLNVAFEFPDPPDRPLSGAVMAVQRGVASLASWVVLSAEGRLLDAGEIDGRDLGRLVSEMKRVRALRQQRGRTTKGDRRVSRVAEHHLYSCVHQIVDVACRHGAEIVLLEDPFARAPTPFLAWKHFRRLAEVCLQLSREAGLPASKVRKVYGSWRTCPLCGHEPEQETRRKEGKRPKKEMGPDCPNCHFVADRRMARLLALDALRLRLPKDDRPRLPEFIRELSGIAGNV